MDFDTLIKLPGVTSILLCEITAALPLQDWAPYNDIWRSAVPSGIEIEAVDADGMAVTSGANVAAVEATPGRWVQADGYLYYNPAWGEPYAEAVVGWAVFFFSDLPKTFGRYYESRLKAVPQLSLRIEATFGGVAQVGGGKITLHNEDGFFDSLPVRWDNGAAVLKLGIDRPGEAMEYADFETVGTWALNGVDQTDDSFELSVVERKNNLRTKIPTAKFTVADWPGIDVDLVEKVIPTIYGRVYSVPVFLVDPSEPRFKVCSHAIRGFTGLRKQESRERTEERNPTWFAVAGTNYYRAGLSDDILGVVCDGAELTKVDSVDTVNATANSYTQRDNFLYIRSATVPTPANTTVSISVSFSAWVNIPFATRDEADGEFTVSPQDWDGESELCVDLIGKADGGEALENVADIIADILAGIGETELDEDSFDEVREYFSLGTTLRYGTPIVQLKPSLYLEKEEEALKVLSRINSLCGTYLYVNAVGQWRLGVAKPGREGVYDLTTVELLALSMSTRTEDIFTSVEVKYGQRHMEKWNEVVTVSDDRLRQFAGREVHIFTTIEANLWDRADATYVAQRILSTQGQPLALFKAVLPRFGLMLKPGDKVRVRRTRGAVDEIMEVLEINYDLADKKATLLLGNMRGWGRSCGFWTGDSESDWTSAWTDDQARDAAARAGYWTNDNGFADAADARSRSVSRWW